MSLLEVRSVRAGYGAGLVLMDVSIALDQGQVVTVLGPNGAGKSTLLKVISGQLNVQSGSVHFNGQDITNSAPHLCAQRGIAVSPEGRRLFPEMTVRENLLMGGFVVKRSSERREKMEAVMELFPRIRERMTQRVSLMSGGEQQMVAIGRALMSEPRLLVLDEPTLGLAPKLIVEVGRIVRRVSETGIAVLLVEQNALLALQLAQYGYIMEAGSIEIQGPASDLLNNDQVRQIYLGG